MGISLTHRLYWKAPYFLKCRLASLKARSQDKIRFGSEYERVVRELTERNCWSAERLAEYRDERLRFMIRHAAANVPYYRRLFAKLELNPQSIRTAEDLAKLPVLPKQTMREIPRELVDETRNRREVRHGHTSGTTGTALDLYRDAAGFGRAFAFMDVRCHDVAGVRRRRNKSVSIGVNLVADLKRTTPPFWVYNAHWKQLYMSSYHLAPQYLKHYVEELRRYGGEYIEGYPSTVYAVAQHIVDNDLPPVPFQACFTTAETLGVHQREAIARAFSCRTYDQYGNTEWVSFAAECEAGSMHISTDFGIIEVVDERFEPVPAGRTGQLLCTTLVNEVQPLIRYQVGDMGSLREGVCPCGSPLPMLGHIEGRTDDVLLMRSGKQIGRLDVVFKDTHGIAAAQVVQDDWGRFRLRILPGRTYTEAAGNRARKILREYLGEGEITIELVEQIERTMSGKFRALVCNIPKDRRAAPPAKQDEGTG